VTWSFALNAADAEVRKFRLYYIGFNTPAYWTDCDLNIIWNGHTWVAQPIIAGTINNQPSGAAASFKVGDASAVLLPTLIAANGGEDAVAAIYEAGFAPDNVTAVPDDVIEIFTGRVDRSVVNTASEDSVEIVLMPPANADAGEFPTRLVATLARF
jgi:hypothetical protein